MSEYLKPLPDLGDPLTAPFWAASRERRIVVQKCTSCSYLRWPPGPVCPECSERGGEWTEVRPTGRLWSVAEYHRAFAPAFAGDLPYTVGLIELDDGPRMYGPMSGDPASFALDGPVHAVFIDATADVTLIGWRMTERTS